jgi:hypothetical protein
MERGEMPKEQGWDRLKEQDNYEDKNVGRCIILKWSLE